MAANMQEQGYAERSFERENQNSLRRSRRLRGLEPLCQTGVDSRLSLSQGFLRSRYARENSLNFSEYFSNGLDDNFASQPLCTGGRKGDTSLLEQREALGMWSQNSLVQTGVDQRRIQESGGHERGTSNGHHRNGRHCTTNTRPLFTSGAYYNGRYGNNRENSLGIRDYCGGTGNWQQGLSSNGGRKTNKEVNQGRIGFNKRRSTRSNKGRGPTHYWTHGSQQDSLEYHGIDAPISPLHSMESTIEQGQNEDQPFQSINDHEHKIRAHPWDSLRVYGLLSPADFFHLQELVAKSGLRTSCVDLIPKKAENLFQLITIRLLYGVNDVSNMTWSSYYLATLLALPQLALHEENGNVSRKVIQRLNHFSSNKRNELGQELWIKIMKRLSSPGLPKASLTKAKKGRKAEKRIGKGQISRANRILQNDNSIAALDTHTIGLLQDKHPQQKTKERVSLKGHPTQGFQPIQAMEGEVNTTLFAAFDNGTAPGPSGMKVEHLQSIAKSEEGLKLLTQFVNRMLEGSLSTRMQELLCSSTLLPFTKDESDIRPIAIGESIRRLTGKVALKKVGPQVASKLEPLQRGLSEGGIENVKHTMDVLTYSGSEVIGKIDEKNAFNLIPREDIFSGVLHYCPEIFHLVTFCYATETRLIAADKDNICLLSCVEGVQQGDPLGPLLFAVGFQEVLLKMQEKVPNLTIQAYYDDVSFGGSINDVKEGIEVASLETWKKRMAVNHKKSFVHSPDGLDLSEITSKGLAVESHQGLKIVGTPIGHDSFKQEFLEGCLQNLNSRCQAINDGLPGNIQAQLILFRMCMNTAFQHLPRLMLPSEIDRFCVEHDRVLLKWFRKMSQVPLCHWASIQNQLFLPMKYGGIGLRSLEDIKYFACLGSWSLVGGKVFKLPTLSTMVQFPGNLGHELGMVLDVAKNFNDTYSHWNLGYLRQVRSSKVQKQLTDSFMKLRRQVLFEKADDRLPVPGLPPLTDYGDTMRKRLLDITMPGASEWLRALPRSKNTAMSNEAFTFALMRHLGIYPYRPSFITTRRFCGCAHQQDLKYNPAHFYLCKKVSTPRHNFIKRFLVNLCRDSGEHVEEEVVGMCKDEGKILDIVNFFSSRAQYHELIDVSMSSHVSAPTGPTYAMMKQDKLKACHDREKAKHLQYSHDQLKGNRLRVFALQEHGTIGPDAEHWLREMLLQKGRKKGHGEHNLHAYVKGKLPKLKTEISVLFQKAQLYCLKIISSHSHLGEEGGFNEAQ